MNRDYALRKLSHLIRNPVRRTVEERAPVIQLKNGVNLMVEGHEGRYVVSRDFGLTCREIGQARSLSEVLDIVLKEGGAS